MIDCGRDCPDSLEEYSGFCRVCRECVYNQLQAAEAEVERLEHQLGALTDKHTKLELVTMIDMQLSMQEAIDVLKAENRRLQEYKFMYRDAFKGC